MRSDYFRGLDYAWGGVKDFYKHPFLWKYTAVPLALLVFVYTACFIFICKYVANDVAVKINQSLQETWFESMAGVLSNIVIAAVWVAAIAVLALLSNVIFETVGAFFFPAMVREYEKKVLKIDLAPLTAQEKIRNISAMAGFGLLLLILFIFLSCLILFIPFFGYFAYLIILGYQYSILFMSEACFNKHYRLSDIQYCFKDKRSMMYGFGIFSFFMVQIPFMSLFMYPGFVLGGTKMFYEETR